MFGLIAEDVEEVDPDLVTRNGKGEAETVRYEAVNAMLLNEFLKEHRRVEELKSATAQQQKTTEALMARLNEQEARIQKVSGEVEAREWVPQMLVRNP
jgi:predicted nuclease with TOPRIM domain